MKTYFVVYSLCNVLLSIIPVPVEAQWVHNNGLQGSDVNAICVYGTTLYAGTQGGQIYFSRNGGLTWQAGVIHPAYSSIPAGGIYTFAVSGSKLFAGSGNYLLLASDSGTSWNSVIDPNMNAVSAFAVAGNGATVFVGGLDEGVFRSADNGISWQWIFPGPNPSEAGPTINAIALMGRNVFAGGFGLYMSPDNGYGWYEADSGLTNTSITCLGVSGTNVFAGANGGGVFMSTDSARSWTTADSGLGDASVTCFCVSDTDIFVGTESLGVFESADNGTHWSAVGSGLLGVSVQSLAIDDTPLFAGTTSGVWYLPLSEIMDSTINPQGPVQRDFVLKQNYPNPFNPSTTIRYYLPSSSEVTLTVFDILGREVRTLVNDDESAGDHLVRFNGSGLPSGVYFYRLEAGTYHDTKKLLFLK